MKINLYEIMGDEEDALRYYGASKQNEVGIMSHWKVYFKKFMMGISKWNDVYVILGKYENIKCTILETHECQDAKEYKRIENEFLRQKQSDGHYIDKIIPEDYNKQYYLAHKNKMIEQIGDAKKRRKKVHFKNNLVWDFLINNAFDAHRKSDTDSETI